MSFTREVKAELIGIPLVRDCCARAELAALTRGASFLSVSGGKGFALNYRTENPAVLRRILLLLRQTSAVLDKPQLLVRRRFGVRRLYVLALSHPDSRRVLAAHGMLVENEEGEEVFRPPSRQVTRRGCCRRAYVRGAFLASGFIADPKRCYHAEWVLPDEAAARHLQRVLRHLGLMGRVSLRRGQGILYMKDGDEISELLKHMEATRAVLSLENSRAEKSLKAEATRAFNCDQGNLGRQLTAAGKQVAAIEHISLSRGLTSLPADLEALARLRLAKPEASLEELGQMLSPPIGKSGVQHRMRRLMQLSNPDQ
ncbi:MAG: DNA-binding protein WhiA [Christensenellales bacterium]|jgi:DNA-binding protein WhiA